MTRPQFLRSILYLVLGTLLAAGAHWKENHRPKVDPNWTLISSEDLTGAQRLVLGKRISLNQATEKDLQALPNIGPITAKKIVHWRETHGFFDSPEELLKVPGIGPKTFAQIKSLVAAGNKMQ